MNDECVDELAAMLKKRADRRKLRKLDFKKLNFMWYVVTLTLTMKLE